MKDVGSLRLCAKARRVVLLISTAVVPIVFGSGSAHAQIAPPPALPAGASAAAAPVQPNGAASLGGEIIVTAQKRSENIQTVPLSIAAFSGKSLAAQGIVDVTGLQRAVPSLRLDQNAQAAGVALRIRGIGTNSNSAIDSSVAAYVDGVFIPRPGALITSFLDIQDVEVLRGPQGTLFGRNSTVGAISIHSNPPSFSGNSGEISADVGNYGTYKGEAVANYVVNENLAIRAAALGSHTDGFYHDVPTGQRFGRSSQGEGRLSVKARLSPELTWIPRLDYSRTSGDGILLSQPIVSGLTPTQLANFASRSDTPLSSLVGPSLKTYQHFDSPSLADRQLGISSDLEWDFDSGYSIKLIDSYRQWKDQQRLGDTIFTPVDLLNSDLLYKSVSQSHELQFISPKDKLLGGRLDFVIGLYYFDERYNTGERYDLGSQFCSFVYGALAPARIAGCLAAPQLGATDLRFHQYEQSEAAYSQANLKITSALTLTLGARYTNERKSGSYDETVSNPFAGTGVVRAPESDALKLKDSHPSWRASLSWQLSQTVLPFFTYSTGFKSGGFNNGGGPTALTAATRIFKPETSTDYELGIKSTFFDRRLTINADVFQTELSNFQDKTFNGISFVIRNAGNVRVRGAELEGQYRILTPLRFEFGVSYLNSIYTADHDAPGLPACTGAVGSCPLVQDLTGRRTQFSPRWQTNFALVYNVPVLSTGWNAEMRGSVNYTSSYYTLNNDDPQSLLGRYAIYGARLNFLSPDKTWTIGVYCDNLTDVRYFTATTPQAFDTLFGVRVPATGESLVRGYVAPPRTFGLHVGKTF